MATIQIPDTLDQSIDQLAERHGFAKEDFIHDAVAQRVAEYEEEPELTEAQLARMRESIAQLDRSEGLDGKTIVDAWYARVTADIAARNPSEIG